MTDTTTTDTTATADTSSTATTATTDSTTTTASTAGDVQGDASTTADTTTTDDTTTQDEGAPESYADFKLPENYVMDDARKGALIEYAKANNLSQAKAQVLVDKHIEMMESARASERDARVVTWTDQSKQQFGANFEAITADAKAGVTWAMKERPNILQTFDDEGWGSNPDALWVFAKLGELTRGSKLDGLGNESSSGSRDIGSKLYDHPTSQPK